MRNFGPDFGTNELKCSCNLNKICLLPVSMQEHYILKGLTCLNKLLHTVRQTWIGRQFFVILLLQLWSSLITTYLRNNCKPSQMLHQCLVHGWSPGWLTRGGGSPSVYLQNHMVMAQVSRWTPVQDGTRYLPKNFWVFKSWKCHFLEYNSLAKQLGLVIWFIKLILCLYYCVSWKYSNCTCDKENLVTLC